MFLSFPRCVWKPRCPEGTTQVSGLDWTFLHFLPIAQHFIGEVSAFKTMVWGGSLVQWFSKWFSGSALPIASVTPENLLEIQMSGPHPASIRFTNSGGRASNQGFNKSCSSLRITGLASLKRKEQTHGSLVVNTEACWATTGTPLLPLNRKQPSTQRAPQGIRGNSLLSLCEGIVVKQWLKVTATVKFKESSLKHLEKHTQYPITIYIGCFS